MSDPVTAPAHYDGAHGTACMDAMRNMLDRDLSGTVVPMSAAAVYWWGCALKYVWRAPFKNGKQDIAKAIRCLEYMVGEFASDARHG